MKKLNFLGAVAFALLLSLNVGVFVEDNNWQGTTEIAQASQDGWWEREVTFNCPPGSDWTTFTGCLVGWSYCSRTRCHLPVAGLTVGSGIR